MSAAATAAGYLYASGRRDAAARRAGRAHHERQLPEKKPARKEIRVAVLPEREQPRQAAAPAPKKAPKI
jgi:hypothetical protein